jgi:putative Mg2+ transporter-C (MgtC) family protein
MTPPLTDLELLHRLVLAVVLGGVIGFERELRQKSAGLRTNILIALGSALFTVSSIQLATETGDPTRIVAQVVTGVGFLGAGAIMRTDNKVQGLTTAATVWVNAALGVAAGGGEYHLATIGGAVAMIVLLLVAPIEDALSRRIAARHNRRATDVRPEDTPPY